MIIGGSRTSQNGGEGANLLFGHFSQKMHQNEKEIDWGVREGGGGEMVMVKKWYNVRFAI